MEHPVARSLFIKTFETLGNGSIAIPDNGQCFCKSWLESRGSVFENRVANVSQWIAFGVSVALLIFYAYEALIAVCGWEEVYVCCVELSKVILEFFHEFDHPAMVYTSASNKVLWLRYGEWLLTCPVILIHLSNLTGLKEDYTFRTMHLLVSDIGTIVWGVTSAYATGYMKLVFYLISCCYGSVTFYSAAQAYHEAYKGVPKGKCQTLVKINGFLFFCSWTMYPILFALGPEGFGAISMYGSTTAHTYVDLMSKNTWGLVGHMLRVEIWKHIKKHGEHSVVGIRNSMSMPRLDPGKVPRLSIGGDRRLSTSSQTAVPPVSASGITWTSSSGEQSSASDRPANRASTETGAANGNGNGSPPGGASRSPFWNNSGKHNATVVPAPLPQTVSVKSRANTGNGMGNGGGGNSQAISGDVVTASDVAAKMPPASAPVAAPLQTAGSVGGGGPASAPVPTANPSSRTIQGTAGGWTDAGASGAPPTGRVSVSSRDPQRNSIGSLRVTAAPPVPMEPVADVDEDDAGMPPPPPPADKRFSTEGMSRPGTSQKQPSPRTYPSLTAADI